MASAQFEYAIFPGGFTSEAWVATVSEYRCVCPIIRVALVLVVSPVVMELLVARSVKHRWIQA